MTPTELLAWRTAHGYTQAELAHLLGVSANTLHRWETGSRKIPPFLSLALATLGRRKRKA